MSEQKISITLTDSAIERVSELVQKENNRGKFLRVAVSSGGCSGFQYLFNLDDKKNADDIKILSSGDSVLAITDETSVAFLEGCQVDFVRDLGASYFKVVNPNAKASCGCGSSFSV
jgi:iron-sulfur cluster assembly accessory protein